MKSAGKAAIWVAFSKWLGLLSGLISLIVVARLLTPEDFGVYGFLLVVLVIPEVFSSDSLNEVLIQRTDLKAEHSNSVFLSSLVFATLFFGLIQLGAPYIATLFDVPSLSDYLRAMSVVLFMGALSAVPAALLQRHMRFREITIVDVIGYVVGAIVGVSSAVIFQNAWALVAMEMSRRFVRMLAFLYFANWWPSFRTNIYEFRSLLRFKLASIGLRLVAAGDISIPRLFVGLYLGPAALGMFNLAIRIQNQAMQALVSPFGAVAFPVASKTQNDLPTLYKTMSTAIWLAGFIAYPAFIGAAAAAPVIVPVVLGTQWNDAIIAIQISMLMGIRLPSSAFNGGVLRGVGKPGLLLKVSVFALLVLVLMLPFASRISLEAVMIALAFQKFLGWLLSSWAVYQAVRFPITRQILAGSSVLVASLAMGAGIWWASDHLPLNWSDPAKVVAIIGLGVVLYVGGLVMASPSMAKRGTRSLILLFRGDRKLAIANLRNMP
ncbi:oligosaccharide flippase family protein [Hyphomonas sp.]|uniref:oligosaccharide flippase family protein n=1 Tax=Hyphomonas sp. TaxID=87 RepID=UPI0030014F4C